MLRAALVALAAVLAFAARPASAVPVTAVLAGNDGNFGFSVVHSSSGGSDGQAGTILGDVLLGGAGGDWSVLGDLGTLDVELLVDVGGSVSSYDALGGFSVSALGEFASQADVMLGSLAFSLTSGADEVGIDGLTFYFENRNYSSAGDPPNGIQLDPSGDVLTLWGATQFTGSGVIGEGLDLVAGGRGLDLRIKIAPPIPEPSARPLFVAGLLVVGAGATRLGWR